jgi:hypothetical protein
MMSSQGMMGPNMMDGGQGMTGGSMMSGQGMMGGRGMMGGGMMGMGDQCPVLLPGTTVQAQDTKDGIAMTFTTTGEVAELRRRVRIMAEHMNARSSGTAGGMGMHGMMMGADGGMGMMGGSMMGGTMPAMRAQVEDMDRGAQLKMTPVDAAKLTEMRDQMKRHAQMMNQSHGCSMMADAGT